MKDKRTSLVIPAKLYRRFLQVTGMYILAYKEFPKPSEMLLIVIEQGIATLERVLGEGKEEEETWIEIELVDEADQPVVGERYWIRLPDGRTLAQGRTDENGIARVKGIKQEGECSICLPDLDTDAWEPI